MAEKIELTLEEQEKIVGGKNEKGWEYIPTKRIKPGYEAYRIRKGDTLHNIAQARRTTTAQLLKLNPNITNPNLIVEGFWLIVPIV